jgi:hypothetical protein
MDEDLKAALFEDVDDEGDFEELDDDFVDQVMQEPEEPDFDFDAHIANLLAKSERILGIKKARGWDDKEEMKKLTKKIDFEGEEDEGEDEEGEYSEGDEVESWVEEEEEENMEKPKKSTGKKKSDFTEEELEQLMAEYEDGQLGEMEDVDDEEFQGEIDFTNEEDPVLKQVLESYEEDQKDLNYLKGLQRKKGERSSARQLQQRKKIEENEEPQEVDLKKANKEQVLLQKEWEEQIKEIDLNEKKEKVDDVMQEVEYLKEKKVYEEWDCETIISTYSTLDNHPTLIKDPKSTKFRPFNTLKKSRHHPQHPSQINNTGDGSEISSVSSRTNNNNNNHSNQMQQPITPGNNKILLTGKMNLPEGFSRYSQPKNSKNNQNQKNDRKSLLQEIQEDQGEEEEESSEDEKDQENNSDEDSSEETKGRKKETPEEKQARKKKMKEERKKRRMNKKSLKTAFQKEGLKIIKSLGLEQSTDHVSVFKYST